MPVTVDRAARAQMARLIRSFLSRRITNFQFDEAAEHLADRAPTDPALWNAYLACWPLYDDVREHHAHPIDTQERRRLARLILFLRSSEPYCWYDPPATFAPFGPITTLLDFLLALLIGVWLPILAAARLLLWWSHRQTPALVTPQQPDHSAETSLWPFADFAALNRANRSLGLLGVSAHS